ncbi:hypothetical protein CSC17_2330 [Klebsiella oxytoca]|nr:hypothetical protein CSC17_2330 [Klebsiella oxytoca]
MKSCRLLCRQPPTAEVRDDNVSVHLFILPRKVARVKALFSFSDKPVAG